MQDGRSRVTVVGRRKRVDVAVPSSASIGEYAPGLADLCGQQSGYRQPGAWSLAVAGEAALPPGASLADIGIVDGQVLYLRDLTRDPALAPVVEDVDELVLEDAQRLSRAARQGGVAVVLAGVAWLAGAALFLALGSGANPLVAALCLTGAALILLTTGWSFQVRKVSALPGLALAMSLGSVPCLAVAGGMLGYAVGGAPLGWLGGIIGANAATALTLMATPEAVIVGLELQLAAAAVVALVLVFIQATPVQVASAAALCALVLVTAGRRVAANIAVVIRRSNLARATVRQQVTRWLVETRRVLDVVTIGPALALAVALPVLGHSGQLFSVLLAVFITIAVFVRARQAAHRLEAGALGVAGLTGLFGLLSAPVLQPLGSGMAALVLVAAGLLLFVVGATMIVTRDPNEEKEDLPEGDEGPPRRRFIDLVGLGCAVLCAPTALGVFGVLDILMNAGRDIIR